MAQKMTPRGELSSWSPFVKIYDPLKAGSIDGTDVIPHDNAVVRAMCAEYTPPDERIVSSNPTLTLFVGRLNLRTSERQLNEEFSKYGQVKSCRLVKDIVTGLSRGYGFVEFKKETDAQRAWKVAHGSTFHERQILVEWEFSRTMPGWIPRRLGGGLGGKKESGQLRFGGRDRPFKRPLIVPGDKDSTPFGPKSELMHLDNDGRIKDEFSKEESFNSGRFKRQRNENQSSWSNNSFDNTRRKYMNSPEEKHLNQYYPEKDRKYYKRNVGKTSEHSEFEEDKRKFHRRKDDRYSDQYYEEHRRYGRDTEEKYLNQPYYDEERGSKRSRTDLWFSDQPQYTGEESKYKRVPEEKYSDRSQHEGDGGKYRRKMEKHSHRVFDRDYDHHDKHSLRDSESHKSSRYEREQVKRDNTHMSAKELNRHSAESPLAGSSKSIMHSINNEQDSDRSSRHDIVSHQKRKRSSSTDSSSSNESSSKKKHKRKKHKRKKKDSKDSNIFHEKSKKHKKKKKSRKNNSSNETD